MSIRPRMRQHSIRAYCTYNCDNTVLIYLCGMPAYVSIRQHTSSAYVCICQHSIRQHTSAYAYKPRYEIWRSRGLLASASVSFNSLYASAYVSIRQHSIHQHTSAYAATPASLSSLGERIRQNPPAYASICQHTRRHLLLSPHLE